MFHTLVYNAAAAGAGASNVDFAAASDTEVTQRNGHYTFSEPYRLAAVTLVGPSVTRGRFQVPHWNALAEFQIFSANRAATPPSNPQWDLYTAYPIPIPLEEEFQVQASNNAGAPEAENAVLQIVTDDWNLNLPPPDAQNPFPFVARASFTVTPIVGSWSGGQVLAFSQSLRGGVYAICGAALQGADSAAFRIIFPRNKMYRGRRLRPGGLVQTAVGDTINNQLVPWQFGWGLWGMFHTFELPVIEVFGTTAAAITYQAFLWMIYLGQDKGILDAFVRSGT